MKAFPRIVMASDPSAPGRAKVGWARCGPAHRPGERGGAGRCPLWAEAFDL